MSKSGLGDFLEISQDTMLTYAYQGSLHISNKAYLIIKETMQGEIFATNQSYVEIRKVFKGKIYLD